jgi:hypothetical protein
MQLWLVLQNVRGLKNPKMIQKLWLYYQNHTPHIDILLFQKHKLKGENAELLGQQL